ncbi:MAG TPA: cell envelope integrity protein CreD [Gammaproteobacteria bacterium]|nr:cell envelope integrity protein CreD [Gammaproteobacteria bacterium]
MQRTIFTKALVVFVLSILLLIPLGMIGGKVYERQAYRDGVRREISESWTGEQTLRGPVLVVPYVEKVRSRVWDKELEKYVDQVVEYERALHFFPQRLDIEAEIQTEERYRGIYSVPVYTSLMKIAGEFRLPAYYGVEAGRDISWRDAFLSLGVGDVRGIRDGLSLKWQGQNAVFLPGGGMTPFSQGVHADLKSLHSASDKSFAFVIGLKLAGTERLNVVPVGVDTRVSMRSPWPHPSFIGRFLPETRSVDAQGFQASWAVSHFSTNMVEVFESCVSGQCADLENTRFGVSFMQPVDVYSLTDRALKYGILFIGLTFGVFFLFEILKRMAIHPVQYGLVGLALAVFYQLLISLSEHMAFGIAYLIAAGASISLITFYVCYVLKSALRGLGFGCILGLLYGMLFLILKSEDHSLLMGSILVFLALASAMYLTRNVDWYRLTDSRGAA